MKFHKALRLFSLINVASCIIFFCFLYHYLSSENEKGLNVALGWIGWLAMLTFIVPAAISDTTRAEWFSKEYGVGTLLLLLVNVIAVIAGDYLAYTLVR
jgi:hypothetical protein